MASRTKRGTTDEAGDPGDDWKRFAAAGGLLLLVLVILVLGAMLERDPDDPSRRAGSSTVTIERSAGEGVPAVPATEPLDVPVEDAAPAPVERAPAVPAPAATPAPPPAGPSSSDLVERARADARRIGAGDGWTLQLLVACDPQNAAKRVAQGGPAEQLYVLPRMLDGRSCFRLCWGRYPSREAALAARDLPSGLRESLDEAPQPRRIADVLP